MKDLIIRPRYTERMAPFIGKNVIKVLTGQRRVGNSCLLRQLCEHIRLEHPSADILVADEDGRYLIVDEVQDIEGFEHALRSLLAEEACDIYITGSNATMLSGELATYLSGRYVELHIHSLTFSEFLEFHKLSPDNTSLRHNLPFGGLPYSSNLP